MNSTHGRATRAWLMATALGVGVPTAAFAQAAPPAAPAAAEVSEVVVTGSFLPTTPDRIAAPVTTIDAHKIQEAGVDTNALEIVRKTIPAFQGRGNIGASNANNTNQNTGGGSQLRLRDLDTLVLINGRRVAVDAIAGVGGKIFVDVDQVPPSAIERVEVLADGASAIYGSDAIGGVVNFILKQKFDGLEVGGRVGGAAGGYSESSAYFTAGKSFGDRVDVVLNGSYNHTDPLFQKDRSFTHPFFVTGAAVPGAVGTNLLNLGLNSPSQATGVGLNATAPNIAALIPSVYTASTAAGIGSTYDLSQFQTLLMEQKLWALGGNATARLVGEDTVVAFGDFEYARAEGFTQFLPRISSVTVPAGAPFNPTTGTVSGVQFGEPTLPKQYFNTSDKFRVTGGLRGVIGDGPRAWRWETAYTHSQDKLDQQQVNVIFGPNVPLAIAGGFDASGNPVAGGAFSKVFSGFDTNAPLILVPALDPFARAGRNPASLAQLFGTELVTGKSTLDSADAKVTTNLFTLPAGELAVAVGGAWRREALSASADLNGRNTGPTAQRWIGGQFFDPFTKSRTIAAGFLEVRVPLASDDWNLPGVHALDLVGAVRTEHYSDAGNSTVPKIGFRWQPFDAQFTVRGTYSKSFTAPSLFAEYGPTDTRQAGGAIIQGAFPGQPSSPFNAEDGNNPNLRPATAKIYSVGFVAQPNAIPGLKATVQYTSIEQQDIAGGIGFNNILVDVNRLGAASIFSPNVARNNFPGLPGAVGFANPGDLLAFLQAAPGVNNNNLFVIDQFRNLGGIKLRTWDITVDYTVHTEGWGEFTFSTLATYLASYQYQALPSQPFFEFAGAVSNSPQAGGTQPRWRAYSSVEWDYGRWNAVVANNFIDSVQDEGAGGFTFANSHVAALPVKSYDTWDARVAYRLNGGLLPHVQDARIAVGVNNAFNRTPPAAPNAFPDNRADMSTYSPIGRLWYLQLMAHF
ncbi:TonB-dependent receptor plug domain-containing protein [Phenylobacterium sp.]|uniref:TonB-dependent receptor plug domain-containing protein n=1 Tax=Phenylobacterium sp. TaxID=1871053 RepID=UPI002DEFED2B|nr:TonB-dependent receptor plug domain-containing protein [Phenylobacterium sp.]